MPFNFGETFLNQMNIGQAQAVNKQELEMKALQVQEQLLTEEVRRQALRAEMELAEQRLAFEREVHDDTFGLQVDQYESSLEQQTFENGILEAELAISKALAESRINVDNATIQNMVHSMVMDKEYLDLATEKQRNDYFLNWVRTNIDRDLTDAQIGLIQEQTKGLFTENGILERSVDALVAMNWAELLQSQARLEQTRAQTTSITNEESRRQALHSGEITQQGLTTEGMRSANQHMDLNNRALLGQLNAAERHREVSEETMRGRHEAPQSMYDLLRRPSAFSGADLHRAAMNTEGTNNLLSSFYRTASNPGNMFFGAGLIGAGANAVARRFFSSADEFYPRTELDYAIHSSPDTVHYGAHQGTFPMYPQDPVQLEFLNRNSQGVSLNAGFNTLPSTPMQYLGQQLRGR